MTYQRHPYVDYVITRLKKITAGLRGMTSDEENERLRKLIKESIGLDKADLFTNKLEKYLRIERRYTVAEANSISAICMAIKKYNSKRR